jgi:hypothetical protein
MKISHRATLALALASVSAIGSAAVTGSAVRPGYWQSEVDAYVPLNAAGTTTLTIYPSSSGVRVLTFSASCAVLANAGDTSAWVDLDIVVNGQVVAPTAGTHNQFCNANGSGWYSGYTRASITIPINVVAGANTIRVFARRFFYAQGFSLADSSLVIHQ